MRIPEETKGNPEINLAPMIDVVFLLLIFFMVATTFVEREKEMGLDLPDAETGEEVDHELDEIVINLMSDGRTLVDGQEMDVDALTDHLERVARRNRETPVTIRGDEKAVVQSLVDVMDVCRLVGLSDLGVMTLDR